MALSTPRSIAVVDGLSPEAVDFLKENGAKLSTGYWKKYGPRPGCTIQVSNEPVPVEEALNA